MKLIAMTVVASALLLGACGADNDGRGASDADDTGSTQIGRNTAEDRQETRRAAGEMDTVGDITDTTGIRSDSAR